MEAEKSRWHYVGLLVLLMSCALFLAARLVYLYLSDATRFPINTVKIVASYQHITHKELESILEKYAADSFFTFPVTKLQGQLIQLPWLNKVTIERQWPDSLKITLIEKEPVAWWNQALMTEDGIIFSGEGKATDTSLPRFTGQEGQQKLLLQVYQKLSKILTIYGLQAAVLALRPNDAWELTLSNGILLRLGKRDLELRVNRFCKAYTAVFGEVVNKSALMVVDLRYPHGMAVLWKNKREDNG